MTGVAAHVSLAIRELGIDVGGHADHRASDDNPKKNIARAMIRMAADINSKFPDGKAHVSCYTCHRGAEEPIMAPPAQ